MPGPILDFMNDERFARRLREADQDTINIFEGMLTQDEAGNAMKKHIQAIRLGAESEGRASRLALGRESLERGSAFREKELTTKSDISKQRLMQNRDISLARMTQSADIQRNRMDFEKGQNRNAALIGLGQVGTSGVLGYATMKKDEELSKRLLGLGTLYRRT